MSTLAELVRARGAEIHAAALDEIVAELYATAGEGLPAGTIAAASTPGLTLVEGIVTVENETAATVWQWTVGEPARPYDPHQALDGITFDETDWRDALASSGEFGAPYYFPLDHEGCQCEVVNVVGELVFEPAALDASPVTIRAFGQTILVTPSAPERNPDAPAWWNAVLTPDRWRAALEAAS